VAKRKLRIKLKECLAIIPARAGSKSIKNKNIVRLGNLPLIAFSINAAKLAGIKRVIVSTDSKEYAKIAKKYGAEVPFLRPKKFSQDNSTDYDFFDHFFNWMLKEKLSIPDFMVHLRPTTPLRNPKIIKQALSKIKKDKSSTSLRSGHKFSESPLKWLTKDKKGFAIPLSKNISLEKINSPRQKFEDIYVPNGYVDIIKTNHFLNKKNLYGDNMILFETPFVQEIDEFKDLEFIEFEIKKNGHSLKL
tara:strand:- start:318 stop:1058 length:741 start_codon:yes stop_codon:yes gene_type:complete